MDNKNNNNQTGGVSFLGLLTIVFIALKLAGVINWSWVWVLAPLWIPVVIVAVLALILLVIGIIHPPKRKW